MIKITDRLEEKSREMDNDLPIHAYAILVPFFGIPVILGWLWACGHLSYQVKAIWSIIFWGE